MENVARLDKNAMPMILHMASRGLQVDLSHFAMMEKTLTDDMDRITEEVRTIAGYYVNLDSGDQVSELLFKHLGLQQAKKKFTKSGDRESVEDEVLTAIQHDHEAVPKILEYKEFSKLKGTYAVPMPKLARRTAFGTWRMFPNFNTTRVPSSRLACKAPNLLAMPNRTERGRQLCEGFITDPGWTYLSVDECLHPSTHVETLRGSRSIASLKLGDFVLTHRGEYIRYGKVTRSRSMREKRAYRLTFDNGESVVASFDHKWPTQWAPLEGGHSEIIIRETKDLRVGERMVPWRIGLSSAGYPTFYTHRGAYKYTFAHHLVADAYLGPRPLRHHIHHKDKDKSNYSPSNLAYKLDTEHTSDHAKANYLLQDHEYRIERLREGLKHRRSYDGVKNPNAKLQPEHYEEIRELGRQGVEYRVIAHWFGISAHYVREIISFRYTSENHRLIRIEDIGTQPMWAITVEPDHNYVLSCGVVTQNSQIEPRTVAHRSGDPALTAVYHNDEDIYSDFAIAAFRLPDQRYQDADGWHYPGVDKKKHRFPSKTCSLAAIYDVTNIGLLEQMPVVCAACLGSPCQCGKFRPLWNEDKCQEILNAFYLRYPGILSMRRRDHARARKHGYLWDEFGRILHVAAVRSSLEWVVSAALREAGNFPIQSTAQGTVKLSMAACYDGLAILKAMSPVGAVCHPLLQIHDELLFECREDVADEIGAFVAGIFETCVEFTVPIKASQAKAQTWGALPK